MKFAGVELLADVELLAGVVGVVLLKVSCGRGRGRVVRLRGPAGLVATI